MQVLAIPESQAWKAEEFLSTSEESIKKSIRSFADLS